MLHQDELEQEEKYNGRSKKIEHGKILNTDTPDNSASNLDSFLKKNKKNKEMSEIVAGTILQLLRQTQDSQFSYIGEKEWANEVY